MVRGAIEAKQPQIAEAAWTKSRREFNERSSLVNKLNSCIDKQHSYVKKNIKQALTAVLEQASSEIQQSEILGALHNVAVILKSRREKEKYIVLISDMLEHSNFTSFYKNNEMRLLDPKAELANIEKQGIKEDFGGAKVYVIGGGLFSDQPGSPNDVASQKGKKQVLPSYRSPKVLQSHLHFWEGYFSQANATLEEFGQPVLLRPINF